MKLLFTQRKLEGFGGTELYTLELARAMRSRGHSVEVYCPRPGRLCALFEAEGIACRAELDRVSERPDVLHAHHHLPAMAAFTRFDGVPGIYVCHGFRPWVEHPPVHPQIVRHVAVSERLARWMARKARLPVDRILAIPNFVDTDRFTRVRRCAAPPKRALLFGENGYSDEQLAALEAACSALGIRLDRLGGAYGAACPDPEARLADYDIAFAIGRCAVEAMASGCAVIPIMPRKASSLITPENFADWAEVNFSPQFFAWNDEFRSDWLARQLARYVPADIEAVTHRVREEYSLERAADRYAAVYGEALGATVAADAGPAVAHYLEGLARDVDALWEADMSAPVADPASDVATPPQAVPFPSTIAANEVKPPARRRADRAEA